MNRIVCIEDEPEMIDLVKVILSHHGFEVLGALGGENGIQAVKQHMPDLVLLDLMMPNVNGWEVLQSLRADQSTRNIPVIIVTAKAQSVDRVLGLHVARADGYVTKPFTPEELVVSIERVLGV